jgi:2-methylisocitrate lyase-like PEP mutase family enzyme
MNPQVEKAVQFLQLHHGPTPLILANVWDVASARVIEEAGFPALATTSAGIAYSLGYPDGQRILPEEMIARIGRIARAVKIPVSADIEGGYGVMPEMVANTTRELIQAGAIGMNLEDATGDPENPLVPLEVAVAKIKAARQAALEAGVPVVVNARTDVYLLPDAQAAGGYAEAFRRLATYRDAGANCVFAPGLKDADTIGRLVQELRCPLNILAVAGSPSILELQKLGVSRVSLGSGPMRATLGLLRSMADELKTSGTYGALNGAIPYADVNRIMGR